MKKKGNLRLILSLAVVALLYGAAVLVEHTSGSKSMVVTVLQKGTVYALIAVSMNLLNGFTGLFSLGQAGFMLIGAYSYAILTIPMAKRAAVYQYYDGGIVQFTIGLLPALLVAGVMAALFAALIGMPVLRLKGDYLAIATLGFAEIIRAFVQWDAIGPLTNGSNLLKTYPTLKTAMPGNTLLFTFLVVGVCIGLILLLINSTYGRAFKAIRDDEIAAEAMGINLAKHKMLSFCISCFFAGIAGACMAMVLSIAQASNFKSAMTYEILLMVVLGGIGSITGSVIGAMLFISASEWWLRGLDSGTFLGINAPGIFRNGFRLVVFSVIIMVVVLFFRQGIMGDKELPDVIRAFRTKRKAKAREKAGTAPAEAAAPAEGTAPAEASAPAAPDETPKGGA